MYKYIFNNKVHFAVGFMDARRQIGRTLPEEIDPVSYFLVRLWQWDKEENDYVIELLDEPGHQVFNEYDDALTCFNSLQVEYPEQTSEDFRLELAQYHMGEISTLHSKILFPALLAWEP